MYRLLRVKTIPVFTPRLESRMFIPNYGVGIRGGPI